MLLEIYTSNIAMSTVFLAQIYASYVISPQERRIIEAKKGGTTSLLLFERVMAYMAH